MKIRAGNLGSDHINMSLPREMQVYIQHPYRDTNRLEYKTFIIFTEIRMITHTSKKLVKLRLSEGGDITLEPDTELELTELPHRKPLEMLYGVVAYENGPLVMEEAWARFAVFAN